MEPGSSMLSLQKLTITLYPETKQSS